MNALADKVHKQEVNEHADMHSYINYDHNHPYYISNSGTPVGTKFTVKKGCMRIWLLNNVAMLWSA